MSARDRGVGWSITCLHTQAIAVIIIIIITYDDDYYSEDEEDLATSSPIFSRLFDPMAPMHIHPRKEEVEDKKGTTCMLACMH